MKPSSSKKTGPLRLPREATVLILDDHVLFREGLESLLASEPAFRVVRQPDNDEAPLVFARRAAPNLLLIDVAPGDRARLELVKHLVTELPESRVVILTETYTDESLFDALRSGAQGYILKDAPFATLVSSLRAVLEGDIALSRQMASRLAEEFRRMGRQLIPGTGPLNSLSPREIQVLEHLGRGTSNREIAIALVISEHTVKSHIRNILEKLKLKNRAQAASFARRNSEPPAE
jgi:DNA-binding NarL/FixJ family response regulator